MKRNEVDRKRLSPMMLQYMETKDNYEDVILFFRLGDFYEMFFEDAINVSHELELTLTGKSAGTCGAYGEWGNLGTQTSAYTSTVASGNCYQYYVVTTNGAGLTSNSTTSPTAATKVDTSAPGATTASYTDGYINSGTTQSVTFSSTGDSQSGISSYTVYRRSATLSAGAYGTYGSWASLGVQTSAYTPSISSGNCYQYYVVATNGAGLTSSSTTSPTAATKVDTMIPTCTATKSNIGSTSGVTVTVAASDSQSGINAATSDTGTFNNVTSNTT